MENEATSQENVEQKQELRVFTSTGWKMIQEYHIFLPFYYSIWCLSWQTCSLHLTAERRACATRLLAQNGKVVLQDSIGPGHGDWANFS